MEDSNGFLQAIVEDPHDVAVRLIFTDWLQDHGGDAYAEFIRVQCELAGREANPYPRPTMTHYEATKQAWYDWNASTEALRRRERELLEHNWMAFAGEPVLRLVNFYKRKGAPVFHRGFVESIECTCEQWLKHGPLIVRRQPVLEVQLADKHPENLGARYWYWRLGAEFSYGLPLELWHNLGHVGDYTTDQGRTEAVNDLSYACIRWARGPHPVLGLEALPPLCPERETVAT